MIDVNMNFEGVAIKCKISLSQTKPNNIEKLNIKSSGYNLKIDNKYKNEHKPSVYFSF